jgi:hypothetical protein
MEMENLDQIERLENGSGIRTFPFQFLCFHFLSNLSGAILFFNYITTSFPFHITSIVQNGIPNMCMQKRGRAVPCSVLSQPKSIPTPTKGKRKHVHVKKSSSSSMSMFSNVKKLAAGKPTTL